MEGHVVVLLLCFSATFACTAEQLAAKSSYSNEPVYRRDPDSGKCFEVGEKGPCTGDNMVFLYLDKYGDKVNGICDCIPRGICSPGKRRLIYWPRSNRCYDIHSKGPCREGTWLTLNSQGQGKCQPNPCPGFDIEKDWVFPWPNGKCYKIRTSDDHPCPKGNYYLEAAEDGTSAMCSVTENCTMTLSVASVACFPGDRYDYIGGCRKTHQNPTNEELCGSGSKWHPVKQKCVL